MILLLYEALCDLLSEWTSLNTWFINGVSRFHVSQQTLHIWHIGKIRSSSTHHAHRKTQKKPMWPWFL